MKMTPDQQYEFDERICICVDAGVAPERAEEIARAQVEGLQRGIDWTSSPGL